MNPPAHWEAWAVAVPGILTCVFLVYDRMRKKIRGESFSSETAHDHEKRLVKLETLSEKSLADRDQAISFRATADTKLKNIEGTMARLERAVEHLAALVRLDSNVRSNQTLEVRDKSK